MKNILKHNLLFLILILGLLTKIVYILFINNKFLVYPDAFDYDRVAMSLLKEHRFPIVQTAPFFRAPFYPIFLFVLYLISPQNYLLVKIMQAILMTITAYFIFKVAKNIFSTEVALVSSGIFSFHPFFIIICSSLLTESLFLFLATSALYLLLKFAKSKRRFLLCLCGIISGIAILTKATFLIFLFISILWLFILRRDLKFVFQSASILFFSCFLVLTPWVIRNYKVFHEFIYCNDAGGWSFWVTNSPEYYELLTTKDPKRISCLGRDIVLDKANKQIAEFEKNYDYKNLTPKLREKLWYNSAFVYIKNNNVQWVKLLFLKAWEYLKPYLDPKYYPQKYVLATLFLNGIIFILGTIGLFLALRVRETQKAALLFILYFSASIIAHVFYATNNRYRIVFIDPYLYIFTAYAFIGLMKRFRITFFSNRRV